MKKNDLTVFTWNYSKRYYLTHPWEIIITLHRNMKNFIHRGRYGYAYVDVWNWYYWWTKVGAEALRYLADHSSGYPPKWESPKKWHEFIKETANKLEWCGKSCETYSHKGKNIYEEEWKKISEECKKRNVNKTLFEINEEKSKIFHKYMEEEERLCAEDEKERMRILEEIGKCLPDFWD